MVNHTKPKNTLKLISFNSGQLPISVRELQNTGQLQNNTVNGAMLITTFLDYNQSCNYSSNYHSGFLT